jgi:dCTP deaminase
MAPEALFKEQALARLPAGSGVLPYQAIKGLIDRGQLRAATPIEDEQLQPASIDLRLGSVGYEVRASFLPGPDSTVADMVDDLLVDEIDLDRGAILRRGSVYILKLQEYCERTKFLGRANPKSTTGRLDLFTRLITDRADNFDKVERGYTGPLYVEVSPKTFSVKVRTGSKLNQLRFFRGISAQLDMSREALRQKSAIDGENLIYGEDGEPRRARAENGLWFSVDLQGRAAEGIIGWKAVNHAPVIDLERVGYYEPADFWEPVHPRSDERLILMPGDFYILGSKERVSVPPSFAAEMIPYDPAMGEFRVHYAGFFDPGFGYGHGELKGTRAILEVRSYEVPYLLKDGQRIGRLSYQRLLETPHKLYGAESGSSYQDQRLGLSKQFKQPSFLPR